LQISWLRLNHRQTAMVVAEEVHAVPARSQLLRLRWQTGIPSLTGNLTDTLRNVQA
jgi:hypothetical protein